jgi:hypothetical protein
MKKYLLFLFTLLFVSSGALAQKKIIPMNPDRPDFTNTPIVLTLGYVEIESGIYYSHEKVEPGVETSKIGILGSLIRVGVSDQFEVRFGGEYLMENIKTGETESDFKGLNAIMVGTKFQFINAEKNFIDGALVLEIGLPFGSAEFKPEKAEPKFYLALRHDITDNIDLSYNFGSQYQSDGDLYLDFYSISCGIQITERMGAFVEHYGLLSKNLLPSYHIDFGLNYLQKSNLVVDLTFGKEVTAGASYWFMGAGFSLRLPE